jgi:low molecular weight phosphotyrosine protein phosphatase
VVKACGWNEEMRDQMSQTAAMSQSPSVRVLIVCLGNICRSPIGEAVLKDVAAKRGIEIYVDSAGTSNYHAGDLPDER